MNQNRFIEEQFDILDEDHHALIVFENIQIEIPLLQHHEEQPEE